MRSGAAHILDGAALGGPVSSHTRGGHKDPNTAAHVPFDDALTINAEPEPDVVAIDEALTSLARLDERKARIVEMRFFGGLSNEEIAEALQISTITVIREWNKAKAWLHRELSGQP